MADGDRVSVDCDGDDIEPQPQSLATMPVPPFRSDAGDLSLLRVSN